MRSATATISRCSRVFVRESPDTFGGPEADDALAGIHVVRTELLSRSRGLAARLHAERGPEHRARLRRYVQATRTFGPEQPVRGISELFAPDAAR